MGKGDRATENDRGGESERRTGRLTWTYRFKGELLHGKRRE